jgi:N-methylhydantoinase A
VWRVNGALESLPTRHLDRARLPVGEPLDGPAVVFQRDATVAVPPGWRATATAAGPLILQGRRQG